MTRWGSKLGLLLWKNWKLQARHPCQLVMDILVPVLIAALVFAMRAEKAPEDHPEVTSYKAFDPIGVMLQTILVNPMTQLAIAWSPGDDSSASFTAEAAQVMKLALEGLPFHVGNQQFETAKDMEEALMNELRIHLHEKPHDILFWAGVVLEDASGSNSPKLCSSNMQVTIRFPRELRTVCNNNKPSPNDNWRTNLLFPLLQVLGPRDSEDELGPEPYYAKEGFVAVQATVSRAVASYCSRKSRSSRSTAGNFNARDGEQEIPSVKLRRFSYPAYVDDPFLTALQNIAPLMIMMAFIYSCTVTVKAITIEKETQVKEAMKVMGLPTTLHWIAWFIKTMVPLTISIVLIVVLFKKESHGVAVLTKCSGLLFFVFMFVYMMATTFFCFMISVFISKSNTAATLGGLCWFLSFMPFILMVNTYESLSLGEKVLSCLLFNSAMGYGFRVVVMYEGTGEGQQWNNIWKTATPDDNLVLGHVIMMMLLDCVIYMLIALYVEAVFPGEYGVPRPWYFPVQKSFWCGPEKQSEEVTESNTQENNAYFEEEPSTANAGILILKLRKVVMFDEPTSGMDPAARHARWDLLREEKAGRTVLLTTHFMDEADLLGDRIAIMVGGRLQGCGSPFFLKKRFDTGYSLVLVKGPNCRTQDVTRLLARHLPGLTPAQDVGTDLSYQLDGKQASKFEPMFRELEQQRVALNVESYGVYLTTMEEVFLNILPEQTCEMEFPQYFFYLESLLL